MVLAFSILAQCLVATLAHSVSDPMPLAQVEDVNIFSNFEEGGSAKMQVILKLPSDCYEAKKISIRFDDDRETLLFFPELKRNAECTGKPVESTKIVDLGSLDEGSYQIRELMSLKPWAKFKIAKASELPQEAIGYYKP